MSSRSPRRADLPPSMFSSEELHAKHFLRKALGDLLPTTGGTCPSSTQGSSTSCTKRGYSSPSGRTSRASSRPRTTPSGVSSLPWLALEAPWFQSEDGLAVAWQLVPFEPPLGVSWTPNTSDCPKDAKGYSWSHVLEKGQIQPKYCLSPQAAVGILRRARKRATGLPEALETALQKRALESSPSPTRTAGRTQGR